MTVDQIRLWMEANPQGAIGVVLGLGVLLLVLFRQVIARGLYYIADRTHNQWDDILVASLRPYRLAWIAPLLVLYFFAYLWGDLENTVRDGALFLILWLLVITANSLLSAFNQIYESRARYSGVAIQGYLDLGKILVLAVGIILSISLLTGRSPVLLLSGLGALTAVLLLIFQDTILALVASVQIAANDLVKEGDWIEVPAFGADGDVTNMSLHAVKVQNFDLTFTVIPTHKLLDASFKNWRGMSQSGGRRVKRSIYIDLSTVHFLNNKDLQDLAKIDLLASFVQERGWEPSGEEPVSKAQAALKLTNIGAFTAYMEAYLQSRPDIRKDMVLLVRQLGPGPTGLPLEIYAFTNTTEWQAYERIQASIFDHLLATAPEFGLRVFQQPTGRDFSAVFGEQAVTEK